MKQALLIFVLLVGTCVYSQSVQHNNEEQEEPKPLEQPEPRTFSRQVTQRYTEDERARILFRKFTQPSIRRNDDRLIPNPTFPRNCASGHLRVFTGHESWQNQRFDWDTRPWGNLDVISAISRGNSGWGGCCWELCGGDYGYQCRFVPNNNQRVYLYMRNVRSIRIVDCSNRF